MPKLGPTSSILKINSLPYITQNLIFKKVNIQQRVILKGSFFDWAEVLFVVPQGFVLGPTLFIIFFNDVTGSFLLKFADDIKVGRVVETEDPLFPIWKNGLKSGK